MQGTIRTWELYPYSRAKTLIFLLFLQLHSKSTDGCLVYDGHLVEFPTNPDFIPFPRQEQSQFIEQTYWIYLLETESINENDFKYQWQNPIQCQLNFQLQFNFQLKSGKKTKKTGNGIDFWSRFQTQRKSGRKREVLRVTCLGTLYPVTLPSAPFWTLASSSFLW